MQLWILGSQAKILDQLIKARCPCALTVCEQNSISESRLQVSGSCAEPASELLSLTLAF